MESVVICGKGVLAFKILKWFFEKKNIYKVKAFVPAINEDNNSPADWDNLSLKNYCLKNGIKFIKSGNLNDILNENEKKNYDLLVVAFYKRLIREIELKRFKLAINIHLSELPKYRGARGINWALKNKEEFQGVTIHLIDKLLDHGPIISQCRFSIHHKLEEVIDVYNSALEYAFLLFKNTIPKIKEIIPKEQNHNISTYYSSKDFEKLGDRYTFTKKQSLKENFN